MKNPHKLHLCGAGASRGPPAALEDMILLGGRSGLWALQQSSRMIKLGSASSRSILMDQLRVPDSGWRGIRILREPEVRAVGTPNPWSNARAFQAMTPKTINKRGINVKDTNAYNLPLIQDGRQLLHIADGRLIRRFQIKNKGKLRDVNDPIPELKTILKDWNAVITEYYVQQLKEHGVSHIAHAYLPNKSIQTNAQAHLFSPVIQFDFTGFYDSCRFEYFVDYLRDLDPSLTEQNQEIVKRLVIDPKTGGVTQGLPVSGALAGLTLIPFWVELAKVLPTNIRFTQYSDDLTFSYTGKEPPEFTIPILTQKIYETLKLVNLDFNLNAKKTRKQRAQYRKVTGIRINHYNQMTPSREDYRFLRHALYILTKSNDLDKELNAWGFESKAAFVGKVSYMRSIDSTGKINRLIMKYRMTCRKHDVFTTWIEQAYK